MQATRNPSKLFADLLACAVLGLSACGGGGDAGSGNASISPDSPGATGASLTLTGAVGALAGNNGAQPIGTVTATVTPVGNGSSTTVLVQLGAAGGTGSLSVVFDTTTGAVANASLQLGTAGQPSFLNASCGPCTGVTVNVGGSTINLANTPLGDSASPPLVLVNVSGTVRY